jgi:hypothetical protein
MIFDPYPNTMGFSLILASFGLWRANLRCTDANCEVSIGGSDKDSHHWPQNNNAAMRILPRGEPVLLG